MSLADELLADLEDLENDDSDTEEVRIKEEPNEDEVDSLAPDENRMEVDESVSLSQKNLCSILRDSYQPCV